MQRPGARGNRRVGAGWRASAPSARGALYLWARARVLRAEDGGGPARRVVRAGPRPCLLLLPTPHWPPPLLGCRWSAAHAHRPKAWTRLLVPFSLLWQLVPGPLLLTSALVDAAAWGPAPGPRPPAPASPHPGLDVPFSRPACSPWAWAPKTQPPVFDGTCGFWQHPVGRCFCLSR